MILSVLHGFVIQNKKTFWARAPPRSSLGYVVDLARPQVYLSPPKMEVLVNLSRLIVKKVRKARSQGRVELVSVGVLMHVTSGWIWAMMVCREFLSIWSRMFHITKSRDPSTLVPVPESVCLELELAADLAPAMYGSLLPLSSSVVAYDACSSAYGVAARHGCPKDVILELSSRIERHGSWSAFSTDATGSARGLRLVNRRDPSSAHAAAEWLQAH